MDSTCAKYRLPWLAAIGMLLAGPIQATTTGTWTTNGSTSASASARGITVTQSGNMGNPYGNSAFQTTNFWSDPYGTPPNGLTGLTMTSSGIPRTITITFSEAVDNPVLHVSRIGGNAGGTANPYTSTVWALASSASQGGSVVMQRLAGNAQFVLDAAGVVGFRRTTGGDATGSTGSCTTNLTGMGCGSIRFNGIGITQLTFNVTHRGGTTLDSLDFIWSFEGSQVVVVKQSTGPSTASFPFNGSNGVGSFNLDTGTANPASSATFDVVNHANPITITETQVTPFALSDASCADEDGDTVASTLSGTTLTVPASSYSGNQLITCTFINSMLPVLRLQKLLPEGRFAAGDQFGLLIAGPSGSDLATTTGSGSVASGMASIAPAVPGETYALSENAAVGDLANYTTTYNCSNSNTAGTPNSSGSGTSFSLTPQAEDDFTCVFSNTRAALADMMISKSASETAVIAGATISYTLAVSNVGDAVTGAVITDQPDAGLSCPGAGNPDVVTCTGTGCAGPYTVSALIGSGITLGTLDQDNNVSLAYTCTVQ